jgi:hypothetical protein
LRFSYTMFTLKTSFKPLLLGGWGGGVNPLVGVTVNSKRKTLKNFVPITFKNSASDLVGPCNGQDQKFRVLKSWVGVLSKSRMQGVTKRCRYLG